MNINQVYLNPSYKKALENVIKDEKVGLTSNLWTELLHKKFKGIIKTKFALIYGKLLHLIKNIGIFSSVVEVILEEIKNEKEDNASDTTIQDEFFRNFESKDKIIKDKFDSDLDIFDEANKKVHKYFIYLSKKLNLVPCYTYNGPTFNGKNLY